MTPKFFQLIPGEAWTLFQKASPDDLVGHDRCSGTVLQMTRCSLVTCVVKDALFCVEGYWELTGVGDLDDVGSDVTKDDEAKVQDILRQADSEMVNKLSLPFTFPKERVCGSLLSPLHHALLWN